MPERTYRVEIDTWTKNCLQRNGATADSEYESIAEDRWVIKVDAQLYNHVEKYRALGETWGKALKNLLMLELIGASSITLN